MNKLVGPYLEEQRRLITQKMAMHVLTQCIFLTPVNTGRARASWVAMLENPAIGGTAPSGWSKGGHAEEIAKGRKMQKVTQKSTGTRFVIRLANSVHYILPLEFGHKAYTIRPVAPGGVKENPGQFPSKRKKGTGGRLRFKVGGKFVFARSVRIPRRAGYRMMSKSLKSATRQINEIVRGRGTVKGK